MAQISAITGSVKTIDLARTLLLVGMFALPATASVAQTTAPLPGKTASAAAIERLQDLGYWGDTSNLATSSANKQAIVAFQKYERIKRTGKLDSATLKRLSTASTPVCMDSLNERHYEVALNNQLLLMVDSTNHVEKVLPVSTGNGKWFETELNGGRYARTPRGKFKVFYKVAGWKKSELGKLYYPLYVRGGVAIHGAPSVPPTPASHGCIRIPLYAAKKLFDLTPIGTIVIVYGENPKPS